MSPVLSLATVGYYAKTLSDSITPAMEIVKHASGALEGPARLFMSTMCQIVAHRLRRS